MVLKTREGTLTEDRAASILGNMAMWLKDNDLVQKALAYEKELAQSDRKNEFVYRAKLEYGWRLLGSKQEEEGLKLLRSIPREADGYHILAQRYLKKVEKGQGEGNP